MASWEDQWEEYVHVSEVNVSNFVSVKLSILSNNYHTWKAQMLSLLDKLKIRDIVEDRDAWLNSKNEDIAKKYDILLKYWILGSLDEEVLRYFDYSDDVQSIWWRLENNHRDVSASKEELEYLYASNVNVSNFVSVKLSILSNDYHRWKAQMLSLLDKLMIRDIVENRDACWLKSKSEDFAKKYDILLKGWILGSLDEDSLRYFDNTDDVQSIWRTLENYHRAASKEELEEYMKASNVNVSNFVSVKLSILCNDYHKWKAQMLSLLDELMIRDIVESRGDWLKSKSQDIAKKYDILLKGWILGSLDEELLRRHFDCSDDGQSLWWILANYHRDVSASKEELEEYMHASNVNVSDFVSVKLSGHSNYHIWKAQMLSLLDKLMIRDFVENTKNWMEAKSKDITKRYNILLKGWILGLLNEEVLRHFDYEANVQSIWWTLERDYCFRWYPTGTTPLHISHIGFQYCLIYC